MLVSRLGVTKDHETCRSLFQICPRVAQNSRGKHALRNDGQNKTGCQQAVAHRRRKDNEHDIFGCALGIFFTCGAIKRRLFQYLCNRELLNSRSSVRGESLNLSNC